MPPPLCSRVLTRTVCANVNAASCTFTTPPKTPPAAVAPADRSGRHALSFPPPTPPAVQNKAHSTYWSNLAIAPCRPNPYNLSHPERPVFLSGAALQNCLELSSVK